MEISILERGDSYRPLVELMGGRVIEVNLDGNETLNPWDLPEGEKTPSKEKIAFLKNLTRHMIGDAPGSDTTLVDNVISEAIGRTYKRVGLRYANPVPTFSDLRDELAQWQDEEKMQRAVDEAKLAAIKLRTGQRRASIAGYSTGTPISAPTTTGCSSTWRDWDQILIWRPL